MCVSVNISEASLSTAELHPHTGSGSVLIATLPLPQVDITQPNNMHLKHHFALPAVCVPTAKVNKENYTLIIDCAG